MPEWHGDITARSAGLGDSQIAGIEADIAAMEDFAAGLAAEVEKNFGPEANRVVGELRLDLPGTAMFAELQQFFAAHHEAKRITYRNIGEFRGDTHTLASAAQKVSTEYRGADAFSEARVRDVQDALANGAAMDSPGGRNNSREFEL
ncbi:hypothetical protein [Spirilliplanes yamanashiensis]|uniref:Uncharacterized protein n=1 Tax=Spirilliplanes yamanashiensis TaxID=42233 RepID=A0A8J3Y3P7_9ACTN|nr:hypothetical protein [Spirilliplanes yamanashiensis]MDP9814139.1 hypothetical protein [Spirilliplanes yamanashiensis]GIJ00879.1 hypothetical protein Sya03_02310 [Spirilliplanes yamanashiensis]